MKRINKSFCRFLELRAKRFSILLVCTIALLCCSSWGFLVHRTVNQLGIYHLPNKMQPFFYENRAYIVKYSVRPDQRRNTDSTEASKHFIDLEAYGDSAAWKMPHNWDSAVALYTKDTLEKYGYVPYWIIVMKEKLSAAFRTGNKDSILFYATDLGHYIGDAHVPLHTSINYDGQLSGQKGLHSLWESTIPELYLDQYQLYHPHRAKYLKHPEEAIWKAVQEAHQLTAAVFNEEIEATKSFVDTTKYRIQMRNGRESRSYTTAFARAYAQRLGNMVNQQLLKAADMCTDLWYTAWVDAGRPNLNKLLATPLKGQQKAVFEDEYKAYKNNQLIAKKLLIARQGAANDE